jgi:hypothetical protein
VTFAPRGTTEGPEIVVYKLGSRYRAAIRARGELDSLWWTNCVPREYRARVTAMMTPRTDRGSRLASAPARPGSEVHSEATTRRVPILPPPPDTTTDANLAAAVPGTATAVRRGLDPTSVRPEPHQLPAWMKSLSPVYDRRVRMFVDLMTLHLAETGRWDPARQFALATHVVHPEDETAAIFLSIASRRGGRPGAARNALERTLAARPQAAASDPLRIEYARALRESGDPAAARRELIALARAPEGDPIGDEARRLLATRP